MRSMVDSVISLSWLLLYHLVTLGVTNSKGPFIHKDYFPDLNMMNGQNPVLNSNPAECFCPQGSTNRPKVGKGLTFPPSPHGEGEE